MRSACRRPRNGTCSLRERKRVAGPSARDHVVSIQSVVVEEEDALWILGPASPYFRAVVPGGTKLVRVDLARNEVTRVYHVDDESAREKSYLNDVRFAHGHAFISDSGLGAIMVVDLDTGKVRCLLEDHASTKVEPGVELVIGGRPWTFPNGKTPQVHVDGIAIDPQREHVYDKPLVGRTLYRVPIAALLDESLYPGHSERGSSAWRRRSRRTAWSSTRRGTST